MLLRCRAPSRLRCSAKALREEGLLLFNYLDVHLEVGVKRYALRVFKRGSQ